MYTIFLSLLVPACFFGIIVLFWLTVHLIANKVLGERKQGCKGPVPGENGEMLCCKDDGTLCKELEQKARQK